MDVLINDKSLSVVLNESFDETFTDAEKLQIQQATGFDIETTEFLRINIGPGADVWVLLATLKEVVEVVGGIVAVTEVVDKFGKLIIKLKEIIKKKAMESIDEDGAKVLAMDYIIHHFSCDSLKLLSCTVTCLNGGGSYIEYQDHPISQTPHRYYVLAYLLDNLDTVILGIQSSGEIEVIKAFAFNPYGITEIQEREEIPEDAYNSTHTEMDCN